MRKYFMNLGINRKTAPQLGFIVLFTNNLFVGRSHDSADSVTIINE